MADRINFEKERLQYCEAMYSLEKERKQALERYAQFYLGAITLFLGLLSLKVEVVDAVSRALSQGPRIRGAIHCCLVVFLVSLAGSLLSIGMVFAPERRAKPYPRKLVTQLFSKERKTRGTGSQIGELLEADLLEENAMRFAVAAERNSIYNTKMSRWLQGAAAASLTSVLSYIILVVITLWALL